MGYIQLCEILSLLCWLLGDLCSLVSNSSTLKACGAPMCVSLCSSKSLFGKQAPLLRATFIGMCLNASAACTLPLPSTAFPIGSQWRGVAEGQVSNERFRLPVAIEFNRSLPGESNPFQLSVGIGTPQQVGNANLFSSLSFNTSSGVVTLQYFSIRANRSQLVARLVNSRTAEAAAANQFYASNISAAYAPSVMEDVYSSLGNFELFAYDEGATINLSYNNRGQITGRIQGSGSSAAGISPLPPIGYQATLVVERVR
jgi:hypothetical protein